MKDFFRFPHTPHLAWLGKTSPRDDKLLLPNEVATLLAGEVVVEEKLDGANLGLSLAPDGGLRAQNRGQYLAEPYVGQFTRLPAWLVQHGEALRSALTPGLMLFAEWCTARHSLRHSLGYTTLPDWFLLFDVHDRSANRFWSSIRRNALARKTGLAAVPQILQGKTSMATLKKLVTTLLSHYRTGPLEGVVIRRESPEWCESRAKLVRPDFTQAIDYHWRKQALEWNRTVNAQETPE